MCFKTVRTQSAAYQQLRMKRNENIEFMNISGLLLRLLIEEYSMGSEMKAARHYFINSDFKIKNP